MCRSIKPLRLPDRQATETEITEAAVQYVRKVSGYRKPSRANQEAFDGAVQEVAAATRKMLENLAGSNTSGMLSTQQAGDAQQPLLSLQARKSVLIRGRSRKS
jgi:hypothetical protein